MTTVGIVGSGPAAEAVQAALSDVDVDVRTRSADQLAAVDFAVVTGLAGHAVFETANRAASTGGTPWLAVEVGGVGGHALEDVDAAVAGFAPDSGCYRCLQTRVAANADETTEEPRASRSGVRLAGAHAGQEAVSLLSGEAGILGGVIEIPYAQRTFLPVPNCEVCGDVRDRTLSRTTDDVSLEEALGRAEQALDERVGVVKTVGEVESFPAPYYLATNSDTTGFSDAAAAKQAAGVSGDWNEAFMKALGEALERYSAGVYRESEFAVGPAADRNAVPPSEFVRPGGEYRQPNPDDAVQWVPGERLATGERVDLPAEFVQFPPPESAYKPAITTGLGLGSSGVGALLSGLYEVVERDATMLAWYSTFEPLGLTVSDEAFETLARRARAEGLSVTPMLVTQDVDVPVVTVAVHREDEWPRFAVGSGADLDAKAAARAALTEAVQNWMELRSIGPEDAAEESGAIGRFASFPDSARELVDIDASVPAESVGPDSVPDGAAELDLVTERVTETGLDAYAARITPQDVERIGFEAVRVLVPSAQPLFTGDAYFGERASAVPPALGFEPRLDRELHPYP